MRTRAIAILLLTALLGVVLAHPMAQDRRPGKISPSLRARVAKGERVPVIIELRAQPDDAPDLPRAQAVARGIARAQDGFLIRTPGYGHIKRLTSLPIVAIEVDERVLTHLDADLEVVSVTLDERRKPSLMTSVPLVGAPAAWALGDSGVGWSIAVLDTGVAKNHPFLAGKVVSEACYGTDTATATSMCPGAEDTTGGWLRPAVSCRRKRVRPRHPRRGHRRRAQWHALRRGQGRVDHRDQGLFGHQRFKLLLSRPVSVRRGIRLGHPRRAGSRVCAANTVRHRGREPEPW